MPKFVTIGYGDQEGYDRTAVEIRDAAHAHDAKLQKGGVLMGIAGRPVEAINIVSRTPCAVAHGVVEVWPLEQPS